MYVDESVSRQHGKEYRRFLLRESYREGGKVKHRTIANLSRCSVEEIAAIRLALRYKERLSEIGTIDESVKLEQGLSVGAVWALYQTAQKVGIVQALGKTREGCLGVWQVLARVLDQGSRLSAVRLAERHAVGGVVGIEEGFTEDDLYENLDWLCEHQGEIEERLFRNRRGGKKAELFLYDVTSSYVEGTKNEYADFGYSRDKKRGKKQIVIGLLCDEEGEPVSGEVFQGNTQDSTTFAVQVEKAVKRFGCKRVTFVGDRGMIKRGQVCDLERVGFHYITAITKPQIETLMQAGVIQLELFAEEVTEVIHEGVRYVLRRNPARAEFLAGTRTAKRLSIERRSAVQNRYLEEHPRARVETAVRHIQAKIASLKIDQWLKVAVQGRTLLLDVDEESLTAVSRLDGCYVIKTDLPATAADKQIVHDRYKDLADVEQAFRTCKSSHLEVRPIFVRKKNRTRSHVFVVMLAYLIVRELKRAWSTMNLTVEEGIKDLSSLCSLTMKVNGNVRCQVIPQPRERCQLLLDALHITLPQVVPKKGGFVTTNKNLSQHRLIH